jgi:predicted phage tail protein
VKTVPVGRPGFDGSGAYHGPAEACS